MQSPEGSLALWQEGVWAAIFSEVESRLPSFIVSDVLFGGVVGTVVSSVLAGSAGITLVRSLIGSVVGIAAGAVLVLCGMLVWMPYRQRDAARAAFRDHLTEQHPPGKLAVSVLGPTPFEEWSPGDGSIYLVSKVRFKLLTNRSDREWNLSM